MSERISYTDKVIDEIVGIKDYLLVIFSPNVDGSYCLLVKRADHQYYEQKYQREELRDSKDMASLIVRQVEAYWTGWGFKQGLRNIEKASI